MKPLRIAVIAGGALALVLVLLALAAGHRAFEQDVDPRVTTSPAITPAIAGAAREAGERSLRFDTIRSIARRSRDSSLVTLADGREIVLSGNREVGRGNRGIYVDDRRYGRVLISWDAFDRPPAMYPPLGGR